MFHRRVFHRFDARTALAIELFLLSSPLRSLIVLLAPLTQTLPAKMLAATERAEKSSTTRVTGMREEADPTVATIRGARCQTRMLHQNRVERHLILSNKRIGRRSLVPVGKKPESFPDG